MDHAVTGIDWMTLEGEILLTVLLTVHTITYTLYHLGSFFSSFLFKLVSVSTHLICTGGGGGVEYFVRTSSVEGWNCVLSQFHFYCIIRYL